MGANLAKELNPTTAKLSDYLPFPNPNQKRFILHPALESEVEKEAQELNPSSLSS